MAYVKLDNVHRIKAKGRFYYYHRVTRERLPDDKASRDRRIIEINDTLAADKGRLGVAPGSIAALIEDYRGSVEFGQRAPKTRKDYNRYLDWFAANFADDQVSEITTEFARELQKKFASKPRTADYYISVLSLLCSYAIGYPSKYRLAYNPCKPIKRIAKSKPHLRWPEEAIALFLARGPERLVTPFMIALYLCQREDDALTLGRGHREDGGFNVHQAKTDKQIWVYGHRELIAYLDQLPKDRMVYALNTRGTAYTVDGFRTEFYKARKALGLMDYDFHGLRHTTVCHLIEAGCTTEMVMAVSGLSRQTVDIYAVQVNQKHMSKAAIERLTRTSKERKSVKPGVKLVPNGD